MDTDSTIENKSGVEFSYANHCFSVSAKDLNQAVLLNSVNNTKDDFCFDSVNFLSSFEIVSSRIKSLTFRNCTFEFPISIHSNNSIPNIELIGCKATILNIDENTINQLSIRSSSFSDQITLSRVQNVSVYFDGDEKRKSEFASSVLFTNCKVQLLRIQNSILKAELKLATSMVHILEFISGEIEMLDLTPGNIRGNRYVFGPEYKSERFKINNLHLINCTITEPLKFQNLIIEKFNIVSPWIIGESKLEFQNITILKYFSLTSSKLSNTSFNLVNFSMAKLCFDNCFLGDTLFSNIKWPRGHKLSRSYDLQENRKVTISKDSYIVLREAYRQLKFVTKNQDNVIDSIMFYRNEMDSHYKFLRLDFWPNISDIFILSLSKITNNYGLSWHKALLQIAVISLAMFIWLGYSIYGELDSALQFAIERRGHFLNFIFPLHGFETIHPAILKIPGALCVDAGQRLLSSFYIFQIIYAFRKYLRK